MRPFTATLPAATLGVLAHAGHPHVVVDSALGIALGLVAVVGYLLALRRFGGSESGDGDASLAQSADQRSQDP
jgi:hypothetical protein